MKIEVGFAKLNTVLEKMGIEELVEGPGSDGWDPIDIELSGKGIDLVDPSQITVDDDGTLSYEGRKILVYIRDQYPNGGYKFHVANCGTIQGMKNAGQFETRYVASDRADGTFTVNIIDFGEIIEKEKNVEMLVCKNCLRHLNYENYTNYYANQEKIYRNFSLKKFFEKYGETTVSKPKHTDRTAPINVYSPHQEVFSRICRERAMWKCEECGIHLGNGEAKKFLHSHHIDRDKSNNRTANLRALCVDCHVKQESHSLTENMLQEFHDWKRRRVPG